MELSACSGSLGHLGGVSHVGLGAATNLLHDFRQVASLLSIQPPCLLEKGDRRGFRGLLPVTSSQSPGPKKAVPLKRSTLTIPTTLCPLEQEPHCISLVAGSSHGRRAGRGRGRCRQPVLGQGPPSQWLRGFSLSESFPCLPAASLGAHATLATLAPFQFLKAEK